jgi:ubiquitin-protein ligase
MTDFIDCASLLTLNSVTPPVRRRRINSELITLKNNFASINLLFDNELNSFVLLIIDNNITPQFNTISIIFPDEYPFKPPKIKLNEEDYDSLLKMNNPVKLNALKNLTGRDCLCCNTITCYDNWAPAMTIYDIISEIKNNLKIIDKILLKVTFDKFKLLLQDDYKNMENMRNNEKII